MSAVADTAKRLQEEMERRNPAAVDGNKSPADRRRIAMTAPQRMLEVPQIPGYYLQWIRGTQARMQQAMNAGFEFVAPEEVQLNNRVLGDDGLRSGNTDLGDRVSVGDAPDEQGNAVRLYLMKQKEEYHADDMAIRQKGNDRVADSLTRAFSSGGGGLPTGAEAGPGETGVDAQQRYVDKSRTTVPKLFQRKR